MKVVELCKRISRLGTLAVLLIVFGASVASAQDTDLWQYELTIYGWFSGLDGTVGYPGGPGSGVDISVDVADIVDDLSMVFMGGFEARHNKWSILADVLYMDIKGNASRMVTAGSAPGVPVNASMSVDMVTWVLQGGVGYDVVQADRGTLAVVGGARYLTVDTDAAMLLQGPSLSVPAGATESEGLLDGMVGVRGFIKLGENWYLPYYADIGAGGSELSWQLFAGLGYRFGWGDIRLGYRVLHYEMKDDKLLRDLQLSGPVLGAGFRF